MHEHDFETWMAQARGLSEQTRRSRQANCRTVERYEGDLDAHYAVDRMAALLARLTYSRDDASLNLPLRHAIPINGDWYNGTATYRSAVVLYRTFCAQRGQLLPALPSSPALSVVPRGSKRGARVAGSAAWPTWAQPSEEETLRLAQIVTPYVRFLHPEIVAVLVADNERHRARWAAALQARSIDPAAYIWERGACAFPGVRRYAGSSEIAAYRGRAAAAAPLQALRLDDNDFPKQLWSFIMRGRPFQKHGPPDYALAHLLDHKGHGSRAAEELLGPHDAPAPLVLAGLYTSAANTVYLPAGLLRPTDGGPALRQLLQRQAAALYGPICNLVPPPYAIPPSEDPRWDSSAFRWAAPVGTTEYLTAFLTFRNERMDALLGVGQS